MRLVEINEDVFVNPELVFKVVETKADGKSQVLVYSANQPVEISRLPLAQTLRLLEGKGN
jgi:hypothetical protein